MNKMSVMKKHPYYVLFAVILLLIAVGVVHFFTTKSTAPEIGYTDDLFSVSGVSIDGKGTITEENVTIVEAPDFTRPLVFGPTVTADAKVALEKKFDSVQKILSNDATNFSAWIELGILRKMAGDYEGAAEDWGYVANIYPNSTIPFDNLGDLYLNFLKDYGKAETYFRASIAFNPHNIHAYQQLFALYTDYGYKSDTSLAADLVSEGLEANPGNETLLQMKQLLET